MKILISEKIDELCPRIFKEAGFEVDIKTGLSLEELAGVVGEYEGLVVRSATLVTAEVLARPGRLKVIGRAGAGVDTIDVEAATKAGVLVMNTPGQNANGVAELVFAQMLALIRHLLTGTVSLREGRWEKKSLSGTELMGKTLGLIGLGAIGRRVAEIAGVFGMKVLACDPLLNENQIRAAGASPAVLDEILAQADFVSLHLPKNAQTANIIDAAALAKMKAGAFLINCARGGLVDEVALAAALKSGHLGGAGLDVFDKEPPAADNPLFALDNFVCCPHLGASTAESQVNVAVAVAKQMVGFLQDGALEGAVNKP